MRSYQEEFIEFLLEHRALVFGDFVLKSGRRSPYFFNLGLLNSGSELNTLGMCYAKVIMDTWGDDFDIIFGPAYKGIPLAVAIVIGMSLVFGKEKKYLANRKEKKEYADASAYIGASLAAGDRVILVDDVVTTGGTKREAVAALQSAGDVRIKGLVIGLDREEKGEAGISALEGFTRDTGIPVVSLVSLSELISYLEQKEIQARFSIGPSVLESIKVYRHVYGA
jgi:orotate phosphoribosyltransferase